MGGELVLGTDSSVAKSFVSRRGLGKMRHLEVRDLWLQEEVLKGCVKVEKIPGESNPADLMTKFLGGVNDAASVNNRRGGAVCTYKHTCMYV